MTPDCYLPLTLSLRTRFTLSFSTLDNSEIIKCLIHLFIENACPENIMETRVINKRKKKREDEEERDKKRASSNKQINAEIAFACQCFISSLSPRPCPIRERAQPLENSYWWACRLSGRSLQGGNNLFITPLRRM